MIVVLDGVQVQLDLARPSVSAQAQAAALYASSVVTLVSTADPSLNGDYLIDQNAKVVITAVQAGISAGVGLPGGLTAFPYTSVDGSDRHFNATQFTNFAKAVLNYSFDLSRCASGKSSTLPSSTLTIA